MSAEFFALNSAMGMPEAFTYRATMGLAGRREQDRLAELLPGWRAAPATDEPEPNPTNAAVMFMLARRRRSRRRRDPARPGDR